MMISRKKICRPILGLYYVDVYVILQENYVKTNINYKKHKEDYGIIVCKHLIMKNLDLL